MTSSKMRRPETALSSIVSWYRLANLRNQTLLRNSLFIVSGHGAQVEDISGDEEDKMDEGDIALLIFGRRIV